MLCSAALVLTRTLRPRTALLPPACNDAQQHSSSSMAVMSRPLQSPSTHEAAALPSTLELLHCWRVLCLSSLFHPG